MAHEMAAINFTSLISLRSSSLEHFPRVAEDLAYGKFFNDYMLPNKPCLLPSSLTCKWRSRKQWVTDDGKPNLDFLGNEFGAATVPVANCKSEEFSTHCKETMTMKDFVDYWRNYQTHDYPESMKCLYLKDWHFIKQFPDYQAYATPAFFQSDWLNEFWTQRTDSEDDYRFVYMGPKGTWTPFHADVFRSYSWSANICGRKRWLFLEPGEEEGLKDRHGNLPFDLESPDLHDPSVCSDDVKPVRTFEVFQEAGEVIFVPSGWFHQVLNLEDTISINHNWLNGCNIDIAWTFLQKSLQDVKAEIGDCRNMDGWEDQCQLILKSCNGIDYKEFFNFVHHIATNRMKSMTQYKEETVHNRGVFETKHPDGSCCCQGNQKMVAGTQLEVGSSHAVCCQQNKNCGKKQSFGGSNGGCCQGDKDSDGGSLVDIGGRHGSCCCHGNHNAASCSQLNVGASHEVCCQGNQDENDIHKCLVDSVNVCDICHKQKGQGRQVLLMKDELDKGMGQRCDEGSTTCGFSSTSDPMSDPICSLNHRIFDLIRILDVLNLMLDDPDFVELGLPICQLIDEINTILSHDC